MSEKESLFEFNLPKNRSSIIKVIGVGGGGGNAINYMYENGIEGVDFVVCKFFSSCIASLSFNTVLFNSSLLNLISLSADQELIMVEEW